MKKFTLVPVGECFEYQGEQYSKTGPLTATNLDTNRQRMIPRSAMVSPGAAPTAATDDDASPHSGFTIESEQVQNAFELYHTGCTEWLRLAEKELSDETALQIRNALESARARFLSDLGLS